MKYYVIAGEASGDLHGANLLKALQKEDHTAEFRVWGGDKMMAAGGELVKHYKDLAFMGFVEVAKNIKTILGNISFCKKDILAFQPDVLILIDYPGFNLRIAKWAKDNSIRVFYYISPQLWAWHESRVKQIRANVERMYVIIPFEEAFYKKHNIEVDFVGHPLKDVIEKYEGKPLKIKNKYKKIIALLPGSRKQELNRVLPKMLEAVKVFPNYHFVVAKAPTMDEAIYKNLIQLAQVDNIEIINDRTYDILNLSHAALVTSGTATLETALFKIPQVVCYNGHPLSYQIAKRLVDVPYISLVNLIAEEEIVTELIQGDLNKENLVKALTKILEGADRKQMIDRYEILLGKLGKSGASKTAARLMFDRLT